MCRQSSVCPDACVQYTYSSQLSSSPLPATATTDAPRNITYILNFYYENFQETRITYSGKVTTNTVKFNRSVNFVLLPPRILLPLALICSGVANKHLFFISNFRYL